MFWWLQESGSVTKGAYAIIALLSPETVHLHTTQGILQISIQLNMEKCSLRFRYNWAVSFNMSHTLLCYLALKFKYLALDYFNLCFRNSTNTCCPLLRKSTGLLFHCQHANPSVPASVGAASWPTPSASEDALPAWPETSYGFFAPDFPQCLLIIFSPIQKCISNLGQVSYVFAQISHSSLEEAVPIMGLQKTYCHNRISILLIKASFAPLKFFSTVN